MHAIHTTKELEHVFSHTALCLEKKPSKFNLKRDIMTNKPLISYITSLNVMIESRLFM